MTIEQLRAAGRKRAEQFTREYQREMGRRRARQPSFLEHNRQIAPDGFRAWSANMRGSSGLRLLHPKHIQFLLPEQLRGPHGVPLSYEQQRLYFGLCVWQTVWDNLAPQPDMPTDQDFLAHMPLVQERLQHGRGMEDPLDVVYAAPDDFRDAAGEPWAKRMQRRLFRQAIVAGRRRAEELTGQYHHQAEEEWAARPWKLGQRRPQSPSPPPIFGHRAPAPPIIQYGRPDLPIFHPYNILPQRPYGIPTTNDNRPIYWLDAASLGDTDE